VYKQAAERVGIKDNIGTHSHRMNKPYQLYLHDCKIEVISKLLNHSDTKVTLRYLGINEHETNKAYLNDILA
jgi:integrase